MTALLGPTVLLTVNVHGIGPEAVNAPEERLFGKLAHGRYTYRAGLPRLLDLLRGMNVPATFFWPATEAERCPSLLQRCVDEGHEVAAHGNAFEDHSNLGPREADLLALAHSKLTRLIGAAPVGFRAPTGTLSEATIGILRALGYRYDSSAIDDDEPYSLAEEGAPGMVELPWSDRLSDATYFGTRMSQARAAAFFNEEFGALIAVSGYACLTFHPRADIGIARAARAAMIRELLENYQMKYGVVFRTCAEFAREQLDRITAEPIV